MCIQLCICIYTYFLCVYHYCAYTNFSFLCISIYSFFGVRIYTHQKRRTTDVMRLDTHQKRHTKDVDLCTQKRCTFSFFISVKRCKSLYTKEKYIFFFFWEEMCGRSHWRWHFRTLFQSSKREVRTSFLPHFSENSTTHGGSEGVSGSIVEGGCVCCSVLQLVTAWCSLVQFGAVSSTAHDCSEGGGIMEGVCVLQCVAVCFGLLQCVAVCCSVLQCVAVCCSVLQCVAVLITAHNCSESGGIAEGGCDCDVHVCGWCFLDLFGHCAYVCGRQRMR